MSADPLHSLAPLVLSDHRAEGLTTPEATPMLQRLSLSTMDKYAGVAPSWRRCAGMTKAGLVNKVAATIQLPRHQTETVVNLFLQCITDALRAGDKVELRGFGSFRLRRRKARAGRNPKTGDPVPIPAKQVPWFTVGKALRVLVDSPPAVPARPRQRAAPSPRRRVRSA